MIRFCCEHCGRKIGVPDEHVGKRGKCPECDVIFVVPAKPDTIELKCENCGHEIRVPKTCAGKNVKCPACNFILAIPALRSGPPGGSGAIRFTCATCHRQIEEPESSRGKLILCPHCSSYMAVPLPESPARKTEVPIQPVQEIDESEERFKQLQIGSIREFKQEPNVVTERKLPWPIDIFLYPTSKAGLVTIAVITLIRLFFRIMVRAMGESTRSFLPFLAFFAVLAIVGLLVRVILYLYLYWYFCECVRDSAAGGVRAPEILGHAPGLGEMFWKLIRTIFCLAFFFGPAIVYFLETRKTDAVFWCLAFYGVFFFPMSLLAFVLFDSLRALNPIVFIGSILSTFFPYCAMIAVFMVAGAFIFERVPNPRGPSGTLFVIWVVGIYLAMVAAHLLGWFYHRYENELNWDV